MGGLNVSKSSTYRRNVSMFLLFVSVFCTGCQTVIRYPDGVELYRSNRVWQIGGIDATMVTLAGDTSTTVTLRTDKSGLYGVAGAALGFMLGGAGAP